MKTNIGYRVSFKTIDKESKEILNMLGLWDERAIEAIIPGVTPIQINYTAYVASRRKIDEFENEKLVTFFLKEVTS